MTREPLFDALEICLQALDQGADVESCLVRYPALADELRPILVAAAQARAAAVLEVPSDVAQRSRARVLQAAAEMREQHSATLALPFWRKKGVFGARVFRLAVTTALMLIFLLTGGTRLVNASSGALPGDRLYPVKRSWEGVQLAFVFDPQTKAELERKFDHERVQEIEELYSIKRIEQVNFQGVVETQQTGVWHVSGLDVAIDEETASSAEINPGATVRITGETDDGIIKAKQIILILTPEATSTSMSTSTPIPATLEGLTPEGGGELEGSQTLEAGGDSSSGESKTTEDTKRESTSEQSGNENEASISSTGTPHPGAGDSSSNDGSGGYSSTPSKDGESGGDSGQQPAEEHDGNDN